MTFTRVAVLVLFLAAAVSPVTATIHHVPDQYATIAEAISATAAGDTVILADGVYEENVLIDTHPIVFASEFILDSDPDHILNTQLVGSQMLDEVRSPLTVNSLSSDGMVIRGLTFTEPEQTTNPLNNLLTFLHGEGQILDCRFVDISSDDTHFAVLAPDVVELNLTKCLFENLSCVGVRILHGTSSLLDCDFLQIDNIAAQIIQSATTMEGCTVDDCQGRPYVVRLSGSTAVSGTFTVRECTFSNNTVNSTYAGSLSLVSVETGLVTGCQFINNRSTSFGSAGLGVLVGEWVEVEGNLFEGNRGTMGAALYFTSSGTIRNNVFRDNAATREPVMTLYGTNGAIPEVDIYRNLFENNSRLEGESPLSYTMIHSASNSEATFRECDFVDNQSGPYGTFQLQGAGNSARNNFWGDPTGPYHAQMNASGTGDTLVFGSMYWDPFSREHFVLPNLRLNDDSHDFGQVDPGEGSEWVVAVSNSASQTVDFTDIVCENPAFSFDFSPATLAEGDTILVTVRFTPPEDGVYEAEAHFTSNDPWTENDVLLLQGHAGTVSVTGPGILPLEFAMSQVWPNPFNAATTFTISLPERTQLTVDVFDLLGRRVTRLVSSEHQAGVHRFSYNAAQSVSGIYFLVGQTSNGDRSVEKLVLVR